jgi:pimeloyl-[acyl-carrier protein] methyl ester esterase
LQSSDTHIIAYHGWGFDKRFWQNLKNECSSYVRFDVADRGYFNEEHSPGFDKSSNKIVLAHSFGLHWCPDSVLRDADQLVVLGGFLQFHPDKADEYKRSRLRLRAMLSQFVDSPAQLLDQFYKNTFYPSRTKPEIPEKLDHEKLLSDLSLIQQDQFPVQRFFDLNRITILHGANDLIVHRDNAIGMFHQLRYRSQFFEILRAGHAFPVTHSKKCVEILNSLLITS